MSWQTLLKVVHNNGAVYHPYCAYQRKSYELHMTLLHLHYDLEPEDLTLGQSLVIHFIQNQNGSNELWPGHKFWLFTMTLTWEIRP